MSNPLVSVVLPAYNHENYIAESIRSVIAQDYDNLELVVLNDGSRDKTDEVIRSLEAECRARFVRYEYINKENEGVARTLNRGIEWARGEYVSSIASDDLMKPYKITVLMSMFEGAEPDVAMACGDADFIDEVSDLIALPPKGRTSFLKYHTEGRTDLDPERNFFAYDTLINSNYVPGMAMIWKREALMAVGCFTPGVAIEDWDLWLKLAKHYRCRYVDVPVASYRLHDTNTIRVAVPKMRIGIDGIYEREFPYVLRHCRSLAPKVARDWLKNSRQLYRAGYRGYLARYLRLDVVLAAMGIVLPARS